MILTQLVSDYCKYDLLVDTMASCNYHRTTLWSQRGRKSPGLRRTKKIGLSRQGHALTFQESGWVGGFVTSREGKSWMHLEILLRCQLFNAEDVRLKHMRFWHLWLNAARPDSLVLKHGARPIPHKRGLGSGRVGSGQSVPGKCYCFPAVQDWDRAGEWHILFGFAVQYEAEASVCSCS